MVELVAKFTNNGVPLISPSNTPTVRIRRTDTGALVVTDAAMTELGDGFYRYDFTSADELLDYSARADGDPTAAGQTTDAERYAWAVIPGLGPDFLRKVFANKAVTTELGGGAKRIDFYDDDQTTVLASVTISADGLTRTRT